MRFPIHKEGHRFLLLCAVVLCGCVLTAQWLFSLHYPLSLGVWIAGASIFAFFLQFFYSPSVRISPSEHDVYAPASGKVIKIAKVRDNEYFQDERRVISVFLSPFDPHSSRCPVSGKVAYFDYRPGRFLVAFHPKSSDKNERTTMVISMPTGREVLVRQVAGFVARRIKWYTDKGQQVTQGQEYGFIKFGSRMDVLLPLDVDVLVEPAQRLRGGITPIARFRPTARTHDA